jgi:hypothetical protein
LFDCLSLSCIVAVHKTERFLKIVAEHSCDSNCKDYGSTTTSITTSSSGYPAPRPHGHASKCGPAAP